MSKQARIGYCAYCNNSRIVSGWTVEPTQEELDERATEACNCPTAKRVREREIRKEECIENINMMFGERYPEIAELLRRAVDDILDKKIKKITVNTYGNRTIRMHNTAAGIKLETEIKQKEELLT